MQEKNYNYVFFGVISLVLGLLGGVAGEFISRTYLIGNNYNVPFFGGIDVSYDNDTRANVIIREPKNVVVQNDLKITETVNSVSDSIVGIYKKKTAIKESPLTLENIYLMGANSNEGLAITSDGWIHSAIKGKDEKDIINNYVVITKEKKIYEIDEAVIDDFSNSTFIHVKTSNLAVGSFTSLADIKPGTSILAINWRGEVFPTTIVAMKNNEGGVIRSSDEITEEILIASKPGENFKGAFVFDFSGKVVGVVGEKGNILKIKDIVNYTRSIAAFGSIKHPKLGLNYIMIEDTAGTVQKKGALIAKGQEGWAIQKGSAAEIAGLKEGDIILSLDAIDINKNNNIADIVSRFNIGKKVKISFLRDDKILEAEAIISQ